MTELSITEYQEQASRTAAEPNSEPTVMHNDTETLLNDLMSLNVYTQQADITKRALFYRATDEKLREKAKEYSDNADTLMTAIQGFVEANPEARLDATQMNVLHAALGLMTEGGELIEAVLKSVVSGKPLDFVNVGEEGGDAMWYTALLFNTIGSNFAEQGTKNINKLAIRFPDKFDKDLAVNRNLDEERKVLEA